VVPLVALPRDYRSRGTVVIDTPALTRSRVKAVGLRRLAARALEQGPAQPAGDVAAGSRDDREVARTGTVDAFAYADPGGRLEVVTEPLTSPAAAGIIREALLTTSVDRAGPSVNRLRLMVNVGEARALDFKMGPSHTLVRIRRDGADVTPIESAAGLSLPLTGPVQGSRLSTIVIDYITARGTMADGDRMRPELPWIALPCLSFAWEVVTSPAWRATDCGPGLIAVDREQRVDWPYAALGLPTPAWNGNFLRATADHRDREVLRLLDDRLADSVSAELTFAEWFSRWDAGPWPVVIDRVALGSAGLGPKSPCVPTISKAESRDAALSTLKRHGLALVSLPSVFVVTTEAEQPRLSAPGLWGRHVNEALVWGSDRTDRFQTIARWRGEASPRLASAIGDEAAPRTRLPPGWSTGRFEAPGWPGEGTFVYVIEVRARIVTGWIVAGLCLLAWMGFGQRMGRRRLLVLPGLMALCLAVEWLVPSRYASYGGAVFLAALGVFVFELGAELWRPLAPGRAGRRSESTLVRRAAGAAVSVALVTMAALAGAGARGAGPVDRGSAIPALFPYDGPFDPARPATDVILRLADFHRLKLLAESDGPPPHSVVRAIAAVHRVTPTTARDVVVDSEITLLATGSAPFTWSFPVSFAHDIQVTLDQSRLPVAIEPGGLRGRVTIPRAGESLLRIRRSAAMIHDEGIDRTSVPVNAMPFASVMVQPGADGLRDGEPVARGATEVRPDHSRVARLGPADRVEVRWTRPGAGQAKGAKGHLESLILWDITPAGDRVRARWTCHQAGKLSTIHFAHQEGLVLRSVKAAGSINTSCEDHADKKEWAVHFDPPVQADSTFELDYWLPLDAAPNGARLPPPPAGAALEGSMRGLPRLEPLDVEKYAGALGVRRPGDWTGRFDPLPQTEPISDESFVEAWGSLPQEPLTLCGTSRFTHECRAGLQTGPVPARIQVKPTIQVQIESGRVAIIVEAEIAELTGHLRSLQAEVPDGIQIVEVTAEGLSDWTVSSDHRLHLRFDRPLSRPRRRLRVVAWISLLEDPLRIATRHHRLKTPWFWWNGVEASAGFLTISSTAKPEMKAATGLTLISSESSAAGVTASPRHRATYRVDDPRKLGEILWESTPPRVGVAIESQMTIHPDSAEWVAVLRYDVIGGPLDAIRLRMPTAWAASAEVRLSGSEYQLTKETVGLFTFWSITPERPIWGAQRFVLRSTRTLEPGREIDFPEVSPLGQGAVDAYLGVVNATDRPLTIENTVGLQSIPLATRFHASDFAPGAGTLASAFRVNQKSWALRLLSPGNTAGDSESRTGSARLTLADIMVVVLADRSILGRAVYDTVAGTGAGLSFVLPADSTLLWATVDLNPVVPVRSSTGTWSITCDDRRPSRIALIWASAAGSSSAMGSSSKFSVSLPRAGTGPATTLLSVYAPPGLALGPIENAGLEPTGMARLEMARADWLARSVGDFVARFDRSSGRDHEKLVSLLINHEMALRSAERSVQWTTPAPSDTRGEKGRVDRDVDLIQSARAARDETLRRAGLDDDLTSAQIYLGETLANVSRPLVGVPEPSAPERVRFLGRPLSLIGVLPGTEGTPGKFSLTLEREPWGLLVDAPRVQSVITALGLIGIALVLMPANRRTARSFLALSAILTLAGYTGGPLILAGGLGLAGAGWRKRRG
jgi:hypothetical protein